MQSFLSASTNHKHQGSRSPAPTVHHGAHHPLATIENGQQAANMPTSPRRRGLGSIQKLVLFGAACLGLFLYLFVAPTSTSTPFAGVSKLERRDGHRPPPATSQDPVEMFFAPSPPTSCPSVTFTLQEVKSHSTPEDLWIVIRGAVLNVTRFIPNHPGGAAILEGAKHDDAAAVFAQFHSPSTTSLLSGFCIGRIRT